MRYVTGSTIISTSSFMIYTVRTRPISASAGITPRNATVEKMAVSAKAPTTVEPIALAHKCFPPDYVTQYVCEGK